MPGIIDQLAIVFVSSLGIQSVALSNIAYLGTISAIYGSVSRSASMIGNGDI